jgi:hypothetical protein
MADPQIQQLLQAFQQLTGTAGNARASMAAASQSMARLRTEMQRGTGTVQSQTAALQSSISQFAALDTATQQSAAGQKLLAQQAQAASEIFRDAAGSMTASVLKGGLAEAINYVTKQITTTIGSYQEGASGIQTAFNMQNAAMESQIQILNRLSSGAEVAATTLALIPNPIARLVAGLAGGTSALMAFAAQAGTKTLEGMKMLEKETTITAMSFDVLQKNGVLFGGGMLQMRETSGELRLNLNEFSKVVSHSRKELTDFGGSTVGGVKKLRNVGLALDQLATEGKDLRRNLLLSGISYEEQTEGMVQFMDMMNKTGKLRGMTDKEIAETGAKYLITQKAIAAFTGEEAKQAQARAKQAAEQGAVRVKLEKMGGEAAQKFRLLSEQVGPDMTKALQQMLVTGGSVVDKNLNIMLANSPTRKKILDQVYADLNAGTISADETISRYQELVKANAENLKAEGDSMAETFGTISALDKGMDAQTKMAQDQQDLAARGLAAREKEVAGIGNTVEQMKLLSTNMDGLGRVIDPLRESMVKAEQVTREQLPALMNQLTGPMAAFTNALPQQMKDQFKNQADLTKGLIEFIGSRKGEITQPGGKVAESFNKVGDVLLGTVKSLSGVVDKMGTIADRIISKLPGRATGSLGTTGKLFEDFGEGTLVKLHGVESVMTPKNVKDLLENAQAGVMKGIQTETTAVESAAESSQLTSTLSTLANQITNSNQMQISKLDELISTMRDKTIWEDMLRTLEDNTDYTKRIADNT